MELKVRACIALTLQGVLDLLEDGLANDVKPLHLLRSHTGVDVIKGCEAGDKRTRYSLTLMDDSIDIE